MTQDANKGTSIFQAHGEIDTVVRFKWGQDTKAILQEELHQPVEWHSYPDLDHSAEPQEIMDMERWMLKIIADQA
jgi:predicted esterase